MKLLGITALALTCALSLIQCPYSKVEESFNLQATHDLYYYGIGPALHQDASSMNYDHLQYPGVVPRTFLGPLMISTALQTVAFALRPFFQLGDHPLLVQSLARFTLLLFNIHAHYRLAKAANTKFGHSKDFRLGGSFLLITACQFHIPFYASRMLPNSFALGIVTHSYADWLDFNISRSVVLMVFCTAIFRCDVLILLFTFGVALLIRREINIIDAIKTGLMTVIISVVLTAPFDSIMWERPIWPEGEVLLFNTLENKSSDYGISPWYWYFVKALPKGLMFTIFLVPVAFLRIPERMAGFKVCWWDLEGLPYIIPVIGFIGLYSILPHKEIRFIFISFPMFNVMAAKGLSRIHDTARVFWAGNSLSREKKKMSTSLASKLAIGILYLGSIAVIGLSFIASILFIQVSKRNYPGGDALATLSKVIQDSASSHEEIEIFIDVASAMTGVSLFGQHALAQSCRAQCNIIKEGYEDVNGIDTTGKSVDYMLSEKRDLAGYGVINKIKGSPSIDIRQRKIVTTDSIFVLKHHIGT
jgi:alpha-1,6-mannosyltransferase